MPGFRVLGFRGSLLQRLTAQNTVAPALVNGGTVMRCSGDPIQDPPLFRVVLNYAMFARPGLTGGGPGSQKPKKF